MIAGSPATARSPVNPPRPLGVLTGLGALGLALTAFMVLAVVAALGGVSVGAGGAYSSGARIDGPSALAQREIPAAFLRLYV